MDVFPATVRRRRRDLAAAIRRRAWPFGGAVVLFLGLGSPSARAAGALHPEAGAVEVSRGVRFERSLAALRERLARLELAPANQDGPSMRGLVTSLADAVENVPGARDVDVAAAARTLRDDFPYDVERSPLDAGGTTEPIRESLEVVADALFRIARGAYASIPAVADRVEELQRAADAIDPDRGQDAQRAVIFGAFDRADAALSAIDAASGPSPRAMAIPPGSAAPESGRALSWGVRETQAETPSDAFSALVSNSAVQVNRVASARPERAPQALRRAFDALSDAIGAAPRSKRAASPNDVAELHALARAFEAAPPLSPDQTRRARHVLERAHRALAAVANSKPYAKDPAIVRDTRALHDSTALLDGSRPLGPQLDRTLRALQAAERALGSMAIDEAPQTPSR